MRPEPVRVRVERSADVPPIPLASYGFPSLDLLVCTTMGDFRPPTSLPIYRLLVHSDSWLRRVGGLWRMMIQTRQAVVPTVPICSTSLIGSRQENAKLRPNRRSQRRFRGSGDGVQSAMQVWDYDC